MLAALAHSITGSEVSLRLVRRIDASTGPRDIDSEFGLPPDADVETQFAVAWPLLEAPPHLRQALDSVAAG